MSVNGPSSLGTLLVQRIDAMLGTTLSQQANLVSGARPDAVSQPGTPDRPDATSNQIQRDTREAVDRARAQAENPGRQGVERGKLDPRTAELLLGRNAASTLTTPSAPTRLGFAAQTILALLAAYPDQSPVVQGRRPLLHTPPGTPGQSSASRGDSGSGAAANTLQGGAATGPASAGAQAGGSSAAQQGQNPVQGAPGQGGNAASGSQATAGGASAAQGGASAQGAARPAQANPVSGLDTSGAAALRSVAGTGQATQTMVGQLANALSQALQTSGMFYESHLANLAFGRTSVNQLMLEPQAQIPQSQNPAPANSPAPNPGTATAAAPGLPATANGLQAQAGAALRPEVLTGAAAARSAQPALTLNGLDPQTHSLVRQQLDVLANQSFAWRGEVWPDTPMDWEIYRRDGWKELDGTEHPEHWATRLSLTLPTLGQVQARITLAGDQLVMHLVSPESHQLLNERAQDLRARYRTQGLQLSQLSVSASDELAPADGAASSPDAETSTGGAQQGNMP